MFEPFSGRYWAAKTSFLLEVLGKGGSRNRPVAELKSALVP